MSCMEVKVASNPHSAGSKNNIFNFSKALHQSRGGTDQEQMCNTARVGGHKGMADMAKTKDGCATG